MGDDFLVSTKWGQTTPAEKLGDQKSPAVAQSGAFRKRRRPKKPEREAEVEENGAKEERQETEERDSGKVLDILV